MKKIIIPLFIFFAQSAKAQVQLGGEKDNTAKFPTVSAFANTKLTYKIIDAPKHTFCYDILADGRIMIHQTSTPGLPGNEGFKTKAVAEKVAQLVVSKIKKGETPPTVSVEEMQKLKIIK